MAQQKEVSKVRIIDAKNANFFSFLTYVFTKANYKL